MVGIAFIASSCGSSGADGPGRTEITVFAASSLTDAFKEAGKAFEVANPGTSVTFSFASSAALAVQIHEGAPADVFASADLTQMRLAEERGDVAEPAEFALNLPVIVVPLGTSSVQEFGDLAKPGVRLVLAGKDVPIGRYAREVLRKASEAGGIAPDFSEEVLANLRSEEANVRAVLAKVQLGEADAGIVYQTDVSKSVEVVEIPADYQVLARYPIAVVRNSAKQAEAEAFIDFVRSSEGQAILKKHGFAVP